MFDSKILDVLIGLVLMMAIVSMAASTIVEAYSGMIKKRGKELEAALNRTLFSASTLARQGAAAAKAHAAAQPNVETARAELKASKRLLKQAKGDARVEATDAVDTAREALEAAEAMASAVKVGIGDTEVLKSLKTTPALWATRKLPGAEQERFPSYLSPTAFVDAVAEIVKSDAFPHPDKLDKRIAAAASLLGDTADDVASAVRSHFDEATERLSGMYKRWSTFWLFLAGLAIAVIGNVSIFGAADALWSDAATRDAVVASAAQISDDGGADGIDPSELRTIDETVSELQSEGFPVGWTAEAKAEWSREFTLARVGIVVGWLVTAFLVTLGAPFWFDLLSKLIALRSAGKPKAEKEEKAKGTTPSPGGGDEGPAPEDAAEPASTLADKAKAEGESEVLRLAFT